jgi:Carboxypeptidase regulatory-like domain
LASILVSLFLVPLLAAQTGYGAITGVVIDTSGAALPGATVTLTGSDRGTQRSTVTNDRGQFRFAGLQGGQYTLEVSLSVSASGNASFSRVGGACRPWE